MPQTRSSAKKRQSRLTFTPLPSSSPARAAAVRYETPSTSGKMVQSSPSSTSKPKRMSKVVSDGIALPTPAASSQLDYNEKSVDILSSTSDSTSQSETEDRLPGRTFGRIPRPKSRNSKSSESKSLSLDISKNRKSQALLPVAARLTKIEPHPLYEWPKSSEDDDIPISKSMRRRNRPAASPPDDEDGSDPVPPRSGRRLRSGRNQAIPKSQDIHSPLSPAPSRLSSTAQSNTDGDDEIIQTPSRRSKRVTKTSPLVVVESDNDETNENLVFSPKRRRLVTKNVMNASYSDSQGSDNQIAEELQEDLDNLRDSEIQKSRTRGRVINPNQSKKQKHLEILKRRRASANIVELSPGSDAVPLNSASYEYSHDSMSADDHSEGDENSDTEAVRQSLRANADDEDSFVEDDENDTLGAPAWRNEIPLEFSVHSMQKPIKNFKTAVEWMIHNKLNPAFARNDTIYEIAVNKLDDEVQGYSGSKFLSSVWNKEFLKGLKRFPELCVIDDPTIMDHNCDACNRSNHPAKHQLTFSGKPYNRKSLEVICSDEDSENQSENTSDHEESVTFYLGRTCAANAETGHALYHWRYELNYYVISWLKRQNHLTPEKILERAEWTTKKREKYSNTVVDGMEESGELRTLYDEFKQNLHVARTSRPDRYTYDRHSHGRK